MQRTDRFPFFLINSAIVIKVWVVKSANGKLGGPDLVMVDIGMVQSSQSDACGCKFVGTLGKLAASNL